MVYTLYVLHGLGFAKYLYTNGQDSYTCNYMTLCYSEWGWAQSI